MTKRIFLFVMVNVLVVATITIILGVLGVGRYFPSGGLVGLAILCLFIGFGGSFVSLWLSRWMAKWQMGVQVIPPDVDDPRLRELVETVHNLARKAGMPALPEVGIYESPEPNAFATGPTKRRALVAVSTGLLRGMPSRQATAVLGHEITHVVNGDMVTMALMQGVINAFVIFLAQILASIVSQTMRSRDERDNGGGWFMNYMLVQLFQYLFGFLGLIPLMWFSRQREFRADAGGARLAGRDNMIGALESLENMYHPELAAAEAQRAGSFQAFKVSPGRKYSGFAKLFMDHPPMEERIAALEKLPA